MRIPSSSPCDRAQELQIICQLTKRGWRVSASCNRLKKSKIRNGRDYGAEGLTATCDELGKLCPVHRQDLFSEVCKLTQDKSLVDALLFVTCHLKLIGFLLTIP